MNLLLISNNEFLATEDRNHSCKVHPNNFVVQEFKGFFFWEQVNWRLIIIKRDYYSILNIDKSYTTIMDNLSCVYMPNKHGINSFLK